MATPNHHREPAQQYRNHIEERIADLRSRQVALERLINSLTAYAQCGGSESDLKCAWQAGEPSRRSMARRPPANRGYPR